MTVIEKTGDIFYTSQPAIGHGCNRQGVMGSGIAKTIKGMFPEVYEVYREECKRGRFQPSDCLPVKDEKTGKIILNLASQDKTGADARLDWLEKSVVNALEYIKSENLKGVALPRIGAGIGGLDWGEVKETLFKISESYPDLEIELWSLPDA